MSTPDRLRALVAEATPGRTLDPDVGEGVTTVNAEWMRLSALAPQLAELLADMAHAVWLLETTSREPAPGKPGYAARQELKRTVARLDALFPEEDVT